MPSLLKTPLHAVHRRLGAKLVPFAGYEMPVQYRSIVDEHLAVRRCAGLFDLSHMGEIEVGGPGAASFLDRILTNDIGTLEVGRARYTVMCRPDGGILDDLIVYRRRDRFLLVVNAANFTKDLDWIARHAPSDVDLRDVNAETALVALQGPESERILQPLTPLNLSDIPYYGFGEGSVEGHSALVARTGYTGEDGFEIYLAASEAEAVWDAIHEAGRPVGLLPAGLGARDTLRLEMKYPLYGHEIDESTDPWEAGLGWTVKLDKGDFVGREALARKRAEGPRRRCVAFEMSGRGVPRPGYSIRVEGIEVGRVTSGTFSPSLRKGIGTGYVEKRFARVGSAIEVSIRGRDHPATIVKPPFYKNGSLRK